MKFFVSKKLKILSWTYLIEDLNSKENIGTFYEKQLQKTNQKVFTIEKIIQKKVINYMSIWKGYIKFFNIWID